MGYTYGYGYGHTWRPDKRFGGTGTVTPPVAVGGEALLTGETDGWATDFLHPIDTERVAIKETGATASFGLYSFYQNAGTSPKMVYDVAGVLGWSPHNYMLQSQTFDQGTWGKEQSTVTANATTAPDGTTTADKLVEDSSTGAHDAGQTYSSITGTVSVYAKAAERSYIMFYDYGSGNGDAFNLLTGTVIAPGGGVSSTGQAAIQSVGNGWYRCSMPVTASTGVNIYVHNGTTYTYAGNGSSGIYIWGAQVNKGTVPTAYLPTTTAARFGLVLDYDPVTHAARGLWSEPQATNLCVGSSDLSAWTLYGSATMTQNTTASPTGSMDADTVNFPALDPTSTVYQVTAGAPAGAVTLSCFAKTASGTKGFRLRLVEGANIFYSSNFTATTTWRRFSFTQTMGAAGAYPAIVNESPDVTGSVIVYGMQFEAGTVASSLIPTLGSTVTRAADVVKVTPASINYSATAGSWWADVSMNAAIGNSRVIGYTTGWTPIFINSATQYGLYDGVAFSLRSVASVLGSHKLAAAFQSADRAITADGLAPVTDTSAGTALLNAGTAVGFGCDPTSAGGDQINGYIRKVRYLPRRKTGAEMQTETTTLPYAGTIASQVMVTAAAASTGASASFTPPANSTLIAFVSARGGTSATATSLVDSLGSVWTKLGDYFGPPSTAFMVTGVYTLAIGGSPAARTVTGGSTVSGVSMGSGCQVISCTGTIGGLNNTQVGASTVGPLLLTVSGVSVLSYYLRQTTASAIVVPTGYTELGGAHINYNNMTASVAYDLTTPGSQNWNGGGNAIAWAGEITG